MATVIPLDGPPRIRDIYTRAALDSLPIIGGGKRTPTAPDATYTLGGSAGVGDADVGAAGCDVRACGRASPDEQPAAATSSRAAPAAATRRAADDRAISRA